MVKKYVYDDMLPRVPVKLSEGVITRADKLEHGKIVTTESYASQLTKGDKVILVDDSNSGGEIVVAKFAPGNEVNDCIGEIDDYPMGYDDVTTSGQTPAHAQRRRATLKLYANAVDMFTADGTITAGHKVVYKESGTEMTLTDASAGPSANGQMVALAHASSGAEFPVALGYMGYQPAD